MSVDYAAGLSEYDDLGVCGLDEVFDSDEVVENKVARLAELLLKFKGSCVAHVGAGLSTSAGIRDFRGKGGVWSEMLAKRTTCQRDNKPTEQVKREEPNQTKLEAEMTTSKSFDQTLPTVGHYALKALCKANLISHIVSQNVDGLFLKANLERKFLSELHGNFYLDECTKCRYRFIRGAPSQTMRLQRSNLRCPRNKQQSTLVVEKLICKGFLRDTILDWDSLVPYNERKTAERESKKCKLHICIGTTLQLKPSKDLVCKPSKSTKLVVINLQPTHLDKTADLVINSYSDEVLTKLVKRLQLPLEEYSAQMDPTKRPDKVGTPWRR